MRSSFPRVRCVRLSYAGSVFELALWAWCSSVGWVFFSCCWCCCCTCGTRHQRAYAGGHRYGCSNAWIIRAHYPLPAAADDVVGGNFHANTAVFHPAEATTHNIRHASAVHVELLFFATPAAFGSAGRAVVYLASHL